VRRGRGGDRRADIRPAVAVLRSPERFRKTKAPEYASGDHGTHEPRNDGPDPFAERIAERLSERLSERRTQCLSERRPIGDGDGFGDGFGDSFSERVAISLSGCV
jgi:hypothetical protein